MSQEKKRVEEVESVVIRFAGDSGDGMQVTGDQFTTATAMMGEDVSTLPDYPAEIRAPAGTVAGVSGFQLCFGDTEIYTPGDQVDVLVAMNPAALKANAPLLKDEGIIIINEDAFNPRNLEKAGYTENPLQTNAFENYKVFSMNITRLTQAALEGLPLSPKEIDRCKNFYVLGLTYWLFSRDTAPTLKWIENKFKAKAAILEANVRALKAGYNYGYSTEMIPTSYVIRKNDREKVPGTYRYVSGNAAAALGLIAAAKKAGLKLFLGSYPITPATEILQELSKHKNFCTVVQAEDEIAGIGTAVGAAFGGCLAATSTSGPGFSLKSEFLNLAVMVELPLVVIDVQRAGPSTGLPTKTEQSDLFQALYGRHGESPVAVIASRSPRDCFDTAFEAARIALEHMVPVIMLSDGYLANGAEAWRVPAVAELPSIKTNKVIKADGPFMPYARDPETLARPWAVPGTPGLEHRVGGLEKEDSTGNISHNAENHEKMTKLRAEKVARIADSLPPTQVDGDSNAEVLVLGWGSTYGVITQTVRRLQKDGLSVASCNLRYLNPLPKDLKTVLKRHKKVLIPEVNTGQLWYKIKADFLIETERLNKIQGQPFRSIEIEKEVRKMLGDNSL